MTNKKQIIKFLLSFGFVRNNYYGNERYVHGKGWYKTDTWTYVPETGYFKMSLNSDTMDYTYIIYLPSMYSKNNSKLEYLLKELKRLKKLWFNCFEEDFKVKFIKAMKKNDKMKEDF